jgi:hypothetical protein
MKLRTAISMIIGFAVLVWAFVLLVLGHEVSLSLLTPFGATTTVVTAVAVAFERYFWRWKYFRGWLVERPFLGGTWRAVLHSTYEEDGVRVAPKEVFVVIRQSLSSMTFRLYTDRAKSHSLAESVFRDRTDMYAMSVSYQSDPSIEQRNGQSEIHYGAALFTHIGDEPARLDGHYFTDRNTAGSLELIERKNVYPSSYGEAQGCFHPA